MKWLNRTACLASGVCLLSSCAIQTFQQTDQPSPESIALISEPVEEVAAPVAEETTPVAEETTPVEASEPTLLSDPEPEPITDLWVRLRDGFQLDREIDRNRVLAELKWYVNHPEYVERVTKRASPHLHYIVGELELRGMPMEFALLPIIESAYDPFAYSHGRAAGLWQFVPGTARVYGLKIDWWYDGRRDVRASTQAALDYLVYLHDMFDGDWLLAMAAYNAGQGNVLRFIRNSGLEKDEVNFWDLKVLRETHTYVPRLLAISEIIANPDRYHMQLPKVENVQQWQVVQIGSQIDLNKAAELADLTVKELYNLNPGYNQWATHPAGPHELIIPVEKVEVFEKRLAELPDHERVAWIRHKVRSGETLGGLAKRYRTTVETIQRANKLRGAIIVTGESLMIPSANSDTDYAMSQSGRLASKQAYYEEQRGTPVIHVVQPGDSLWEIAQEYKVGMRELAKWNGRGTTGLLHPGTELKVYTNAATKSAKPMTTERVRKLNYRVRAGESLSLIASKFNVTVQSIKSWNQALTDQKYIHPGDELTLYVDVTRLIN